MTQAMTTLKLCSSCTAGTCNDDWTHLDMQCTCPTGEAHKDDCPAETEYASIMAALEYWGYLTFVDPLNCIHPDHSAHRTSGYFDCALCNEIDIGVGGLFTSEREPS